MVFHHKFTSFSNRTLTPKFSRINPIIAIISCQTLTQKFLRINPINAFFSVRTLTPKISRIILISIWLKIWNKSRWPKQFHQYNNIIITIKMTQNRSNSHQRPRQRTCWHQPSGWPSHYPLIRPYPWPLCHRHFDCRKLKKIE